MRTRDKKSQTTFTQGTSAPNEKHLRPQAEPSPSKPDARPFISAPWQRERSSRLRAWCKVIDTRRAQRIPVWQTVKRIARVKRFYRCEPARRMKLSPRTLNRIYFQWRAAGRSDRVFDLHYTSTRIQFTRAHWTRICAAIMDAQTLSLARVRQIAFKGREKPSEDSFYRRLTAHQRARCRALFQQRRKLVRESNALARRIEREEAAH